MSVTVGQVVQFRICCEHIVSIPPVGLLRIIDE